MVFSRYFVLLVCLSTLFSQRAYAHNTLISTYYFENTAMNEWVLTVSMPLAGLHEALLQSHSEKELLPEGGSYNKSIAMDYLQQHSKITVNSSTSISLETIDAQINNHQSNFIFKLVGMPTDVDSMNFYIPAMSEIGGHVNIARVSSNSIRDKVVLSYSNNYTGRIEF